MRNLRLCKLVLILACASFVLVPTLAEAGGYYRSYHGYGHKSYYKHGYYGHGYRGHGYRKHHGYRKYHNGDGIEAGEILAGVFLGGLLLYALTRPYNDGYAHRQPRQSARAPVFFDCRVTTGQSYVGGQIRLYEGELCRTGRPGWYLRPGSVRFVGYAD